MTAAPPKVTAQAQGEYRWVYLWHWPIRAMHWLAAVAIVVLVVTGFYIGKPYFMTGGELGTAYAMGWMRFLHFAAAGVLVATGVVRIYSLLMGNKFEKWSALLPVRPRDWINLYRTIKRYLLIHPERGPHYLGHNPLQQFSYTGIYAVTLVMVLTGFTMYGLHDPNSIFYALFTRWVSPLFGGIQVVRFVHHVLTWVFIIFVPVHVYLAMRADVMDREGTISSIFSGGRFVKADNHYEDD